MAYQSFEDQIGDSNSFEKLTKIHLPQDLSGKSVLDIGCNEGFFCREAIKRGAKRVVGIDMNEKVIDKARERVPEAEFITSSWWSIPNEKFDLILFMSAIHYEREQRLLLNYIRSYLKQDGILILECGAFPDMESSGWRVVQRHDGPLKFPTFRLLLEELLSDYSTRDMGHSVRQSGDPVPRYVFHCTPRLPTIFTIGGASKAGKTSFTRLFAKKGIRTIYSDFTLEEIKRNPHNLSHEFVEYTKDNLINGQVEIFVKKMMADGKVNSFCKLLLEWISKDDEITIVEGYAFSYPEFREAFNYHARKSGYRVVNSQI